MNIQQFLSQQPIDKLIHQYFSLSSSSTVSDKLKKQQQSLVNSILIYLAQNHKIYQFHHFYIQCKYQLQVNNEDRQAINKLARLLSHVLNKSNYLLKNVDIKFLIQEVLQFFLSKVFVTVCSAECIKVIWAVVNAFGTTHIFGEVNNNSKKCDTEGKKCCQSKMVDEKYQNNQQNSRSCKCKNTQSSCSKGSNQLKVPSIITQHQKICGILIKKLLKTFKLHVKSYPFKVRKDIYKILNYILKFIKYSQQILTPILKGPSQKQQNSSTLLILQLDISKQQLIQIIIKNQSQQKDPRNMCLILSNYLLLIKMFSPQLIIFNYKQQIFQNIEVYYPLSMQGDQSDFQIDLEDQFKEKDLIRLLDQCLLEEIFKEEVREMLIEKMLSPPIHQYVSLYVKYIKKFNINNNKKKNQNKEDYIREAKNNYAVLTMNLLNRLCEQEYLLQVYDQQHNQSSKSLQSYSLASLISNILINVFQSSSCHSSILYQQYGSQYEQKYIQFMNELIINKLLNFAQNSKYAGTIIQIIKEILNNNNKQIKLTYGNHVNFEQIMISFIIQKFMQYWSAKGEIAFKLGNFLLIKICLGLLIVVLNKKLLNVSIKIYIKSDNKNDKDSHLLDMLLITLGNIYENYKQVDQVKIMILKILLLIAGIFRKLNHQSSSLNMKKIRILNNNIVFKDCLKIGQLIKNETMKKVLMQQDQHYQQKQKQKNVFSSSQPAILKCYIDYLFDLYMNQHCENITEEQINLFKDVLLIKNSQQSNDYCKIKYFDVILYGIIRFMSNYTISSNSFKYFKQLNEELCKFMLKLLFSKQQDIIMKFVDMLKYYKYECILKIMLNLLSKIKQNNQTQLSYFFINISFISQIVSRKFQQEYQVELQTSESYYQIVMNDLQKLYQSQSQQSNILIKSLFWYLFKGIWRRVIWNMKDIKRSQQLNALINNQTEQINNKIVIQTTNRIRSIILLQIQSLDFSNQNNKLQLDFEQLQTTILYVRYLKSVGKQNLLKFNYKLITLYEPCMIEYFWATLVNKINSDTLSQQMKQEIVSLLQYLPENQLKKYAEKILPIIIFESEQMKQQNSNVKNFDYSKSQLISKIVNNLPQSSLIVYVLPYCLNFLKIIAISIVNQQKTQYKIQNIVATNKILYNLGIKGHNNKKSQQFMYEKLSKALESQKKFIINYLGKLIYHKKRVIRQSSRALLAQFQQRK